MERKWSVHEEAKSFSKECEQTFGGLRLYPFVRRFNATTRKEYHKSVDDGFRLTVATPHLVPPQCWNYLCYRGPDGEVYSPNPNPHVNEWHKHNPPPGTAYNLQPRLNHPSLINRADSAQRLDALLEAAPSERNLRWYLYNTRYNKKPTYDQAVALFHPVLAYSTRAMSAVAATAHDQPARYEELMSKAATLHVDYYFKLAEYFENRDETKAIGYFEKAVSSGGNSLTAAHHADWAIRYYLKSGYIAKARETADEAGEAYSGAGLIAKAKFLEATGQYAEAFEWFSKNEERYDSAGPLMQFCVRYKQKTGDPRFDRELQKRIRKLFPRGLEKVTLADFKAAPTEGVLVAEESELVHAAGMKTGNVIVGVYGIRVHNFPQYDFARDTSTNPELELIVWQGNGYREIHASPPEHRFSANFTTYAGK
jgi:tetratricopeptide (TPR) repeat protein